LIVTDPLVLDAWAILAYLEDRPSAVGRLDDYLEEASSGQRPLFMSWINLGEVEYIIRRRQGEAEAQDVLDLLQFLPIRYEDVTPERIHEAAKVKAEGGLSYADAFVVALAEEKEARIVTGDPEILQTCPDETVIDLS
jgi:predicted nucleic acid-binding protein